MKFSQQIKIRVEEFGVLVFPEDDIEKDKPVKEEKLPVIYSQLDLLKILYVVDKMY